MNFGRLVVMLTRQTREAQMIQVQSEFLISYLITAIDAVAAWPLAGFQILWPIHLCRRGSQFRSSRKDGLLFLDDCLSNLVEN